MKRALLPLLLLAATAADAAPPTQPGPVLEAAAEAAWAPLFSRLAARRQVFSAFEEQRWFGIRKTPVVLAGEMRLDPERGLSLRYLEPEERLVVLDGKGVLLRDERGSRSLPSDTRAGRLERALLPALRFDLDELRAGFVIHAARDGDDWRLDLEPKDASVRRTLGQLSIKGQGTAVTQLEFQRSASQRVVIRILSTQDPATFSAEELGRWFR